MRRVCERVLERVVAQEVGHKARALFPVVELGEGQLAGAERGAQKLLHTALVPGGQEGGAALGVVLHELQALRVYQIQIEAYKQRSKRHETIKYPADITVSGCCILERWSGLHSVLATRVHYLPLCLAPDCYRQQSDC